MTNIIAIAASLILSVESSGGMDLRNGDGGRAVGPYQMWTCAVDEANRIERIYSRRFGRKPRRWTYADRRNLIVSHEMCELTLIWHYYRRGIVDPIELACRWNKPYGKPSFPYRKKVIKAMKESM